MGCPQCLHPAISFCRSAYHLTHAGTQINIYIQSSTLILPGLAASSTPKLPFLAGARWLSQENVSVSIVGAKSNRRDNVDRTPFLSSQRVSTLTA